MDILSTVPLMPPQLRVKQLVRLLEVNGPPLEIPYVPAQWPTGKGAFYTYWQRLKRASEQEAAKLRIERKGEMAIVSTSWREVDGHPRVSDGAIGGYRIYRIAAGVMPARVPQEREKERTPTVTPENTAAQRAVRAAKEARARKEIA